MNLSWGEPHQVRDTRYTAPGDKLQSAASRLAEWVSAQGDVPYEVRMAAIEARGAVRQWTLARSRPSRP